MNNKTIEELEQSFDEADAALETLRREQAQVLRGFALAVAAKDRAQVAAFVLRRGQLPAEIAAAEVAAIHCELALMDAENVQDAAKVTELKPELNAAQQALKSAQAKLLLAQRALGGLEHRMSGRRGRKQARNNRLETILNEQMGLTEQWPVVRSKQR